MTVGQITDRAEYAGLAGGRGSGVQAELEQPLRYPQAMSAAPVVVVGAGGFGRETRDVIDAMAESGCPVEFIGYLDDGHPELALLDGAPILGGVDALANLAVNVQYVIGIGIGSVRRRIDEKASGTSREAAVLIHPSAVLGKRSVVLAPGVIVCANASLTTNILVGRHTHINLNSTVGHDAVLGQYVTVNPGATVSGGVVLEDEVNVGTGASVIQGRRVGARTVLGAGAAVVKDLPPDVVAVGVPALPRG